MFALGAMMVAPGYAQTAEKGDFNIGFTVGAGLSDVRFDRNYELSALGDENHGIANFHGGVVVDYALADAFFLESGLSFQRKGYGYETEYEERLETGERSIETDVTVNMFYLQVPLLFNYRFMIGKIGLIPQVGPYFAFGVGGKTKMSSEAEFEPIVGKETHSLTETKVSSFDESNGNERFDVGIRYAVSAAFSTRQKVTVGYDMGLMDIDRREGSLKNKHGLLFASYTFYLK